jgi:hypothetical protein
VRVPDDFLIEQANGVWARIRANDVGDGVLVPVLGAAADGALVVISAEGEWAQIATEADADTVRLLTSTDTATTFFNLQQPNGGWARIGAVVSAGVLVLCVQEA